MAKAKLVFESPETFLSFPALSPYTYAPDRLQFGSSADMTVQDLAELSEFSRITNQIPRGTLFPTEEGEYLWDVYREMLQTGEVATGTLTAQDQAEYNEAMKVLYETTPDGLRQDSEMHRTYRQHRDANFEALEEFKNQQSTAETSADPAVQARWRDEDEPRLRAELKQLEEEWIAAGNKVAIESAQQVEQAMAARAAASTWAQWKTSFMDGIDLQTGADLIQFAPTGYSPYDVFDADNWQTFTLTRDEMNALVAQAPAELIPILGSISPDESIESVTFEYRSVALTRSWLKTPIFRARFWRLPHGSEEISEGSNPTEGRCPAYISALVFARRVNIKRRAGADASAGVLAGPQVLMQLDPALVQLKAPSLLKVRDHRAGSVVRRSLAEAVRAGRDAPALAAVASARPAAVGARLRASSFVSSPARASVVAGAGVSVSALRMSVAAVARDHRAVTVRDHRAESVRDHRRALVRDHRSVPVQPESEPTPPPTPEPEPTPNEDVTILAFICKRVPKCPDPDPALTWR
jgi:hypothetical protein